MAIDIQSDRILTFQEAARSLPGTPHLSTLHRWRLKGIRGVRLKSCLIGGKRYTSREALQQFVDATSAATDRRISPPQMPLTIRARPHDRNGNHRQRCAATVLDAAGI